MISGTTTIKNGRYYAVLTLPAKGGKSKQKWVAMKLDESAPKKTVKQRLDEMRLEYSDIASVEAVEIRFCDYIKKWNEETKEDKSVTTYDGYCHMINKYLYPYFEIKGLTLADLRPMDIEEYYRYLQKKCGLKGTTALKHHQIINTSLQYAVYNRLLKDNPAKLAKKPKKEKTDIKYYTTQELEKLLKVSKGDVLETAIRLAVWFGLRREEVLGLRWENVDLERGTIHICETVVRAKQDDKLQRIVRKTTKTETSNRCFEIAPVQIDYLKTVKEKQRIQKIRCGDCYIDSDYVCVDLMGKPIEPDYLTSHYAKLRNDNHLKAVTFHGLRHSTATFMLENGFSMKQVQEFLGHSEYSFTADTYAHVYKESLADMTRSIAKLSDS